MPESLEAPRPAVDDSTHQLKDFGQGFFHGMVENPYNGIVQITNKVTSANLPELHLVDAEVGSRSVGGFLGNLTGTAASFYALNRVVGGTLGTISRNAIGAEIGANALRMGITGALYQGAFTPSDPNSGNFALDRVTSGLVGGATFAFMGAAARFYHYAPGGGMGQSAEFDAVAHPLVARLWNGALMGAWTGVAHAEANAIFKHGDLLPGIEDLTRDVANYAAFGMAFGVVGHVAEKIEGSKGIQHLIQGHVARPRLDLVGDPLREY